MLSFIPLAGLYLALSAYAAPSAYPSDFYLVTTTDSQYNSNSSLLADVSATTLFDPENQSASLLRQIGPGYNSLPTFNLTSGTLETLGYNVFSESFIEYNSTELPNGRRLKFLPATGVTADVVKAVKKVEHFALESNYLVTLRGSETGWTVCPGPLGQSVISWKGTAATCQAVYIQAVAKPPY